jgi:Arc/MetJ-type ribon-helix-helix transcriptional regulator
MASDKAHVGVRIPEQQKTQWEEAAEESGYGSLSQFVKNAVESHMADATDAQTQAQTPQDTEVMATVLDKLEGLSNDMSSLEQAVADVSEEQSGAGYDFDRVLLELLPTAPDSATVPAGEGGAEETIARPSEGGSHPSEWAVTPSGLASRIGGDKEAVGDRLRHLERTVTEVADMEYDGTVYYYKESDY